MFGLFRYVFSLCVLFSHLYAKTPDGPAAYAVWGFYCLSGYLISLVLNEKYGFDRQGLKSFAVSRTLRLLPAYYAVCLLTVVVYSAFPDAARTFTLKPEMPGSAIKWFHIVIPVWFRRGGLLPQFGAVRIEILFYALMALGLARYKGVAWFWGGLSAIVCVVLTVGSASFSTRYATPWGASIAFAVGVLIEHHRQSLPSWKSPWAILAAAVVWGGHIVLIRSIAPDEIFRWGLYTGLVASAVSIILLRDVNPREVPDWLAKADQSLGDLSYPIYLCHWTVAVVASVVLGGKGRSSLTQLALSFVAIHILSWVIFRYVETPGDRLRKRLTARATVKDCGGAGGRLLGRVPASSRVVT
ncbi:acyltransferase family protein [Tundrisphaera lichenicola]|uniref:acyltransferase family protein n=1 Tax=Tundrisphaera lichenicola TaxID=2029860 RepID=UPI003EC15460